MQFVHENMKLVREVDFLACKVDDFHHANDKKVFLYQNSDVPKLKVDM